MEIGRVCVKIAGKDAGKKCVVVETINKNFVIIDSPAIKRRRCNIRHLEPLSEKIEIGEKSDKKKVEDALKKAKINIEA